METRTNNWKVFKFDKIIGPSVDQEKVFEELHIKSLISKVVDVSRIQFQGFHATIFAYGQTGSGKTFTMEGYDYMPSSKGNTRDVKPLIKDSPD